jgi:D-3-phosphoglycerate dehydrogenase
LTFNVRSISLDFGKVTHAPRDLLLQNDCEFEIVTIKSGAEAEMIEVVKDVDAIVVGLQPITEKVLKFANRLKVIGRHGAGVDNIDLKAAGQRGIPVIYAPGANAHSVADFTIGLILALARKIPFFDRTTKNGEWKRIFGNEIWGKTVGIFGLGQIGLEVAKRARGFNMTTIAYDIVKNQSLAQECGVVYKRKEDVLAESDFVTLHLPLSEDTLGFISEPELKAMKNTAVLVNTSRGGIVDEKALYRALKDGWIGGAALDVFEKEPPQKTSLFALDNVITTPHMAGITVEGLDRTGMTVAQDMIAVLKGQMPKFLANEKFVIWPMRSKRRN